MSCDSVLPLLYDLVDGDIGREQAVAVALHLGTCRDCAERLEQIRTAEALYAAKTSVLAPPDLSRRVGDAIRDGRPQPVSDAWNLGLATATAVVCAATAFALGSGEPGTLSSAASRISIALARWLGWLRTPELSTSFAEFWSRVTAWLAAPAALGGGVALLAALLGLQICGSAALLFARSGRDSG